VATEGYLRAVRIAVLARFNQPLGFAEHRAVHENHVLLFGSWVEEVARDGADFITAG
jgi:hypothetical protein